ncbi:MAG TPA: hypothetical protein VF657_19195, partial [Actinoplanes sp.]
MAIGSQDSGPNPPDETSRRDGQAVARFAPRGRVAQYVDLEFDPDERYSAAARELIDEGIPKNTREAYLRAAWRYVQWCGETGRQHMPATPATVVEFILYLGRQPGRYNGVGPDGRELPFRSLAPESVR